MVRKLRKYGAEVIKFCGTGGVLSKTDAVAAQQFNLEEMKASLTKPYARAASCRSRPRHFRYQGCDPAGVDTVEHASLADEEAFALAKQHAPIFNGYLR